MKALCQPRCWTPKPCPKHGNDMPPRGRSSALEAYVCCELSQDVGINPRHLWSIHDEVRRITDPEGWRIHLNDCAECRGESEQA